MKLCDFDNKIQNTERKVLPKAVFEPNGERLLRESVDTESVLLLFLFLFSLTILIPILPIFLLLVCATFIYISIFIDHF